MVSFPHGITSVCSRFAVVFSFWSDPLAQERWLLHSLNSSLCLPPFLFRMCESQSTFFQSYPITNFLSSLTLSFFLWEMDGRKIFLFLLRFSLPPFQLFLSILVFLPYSFFFFTFHFPLIKAPAWPFSNVLCPFLSTILPFHSERFVAQFFLLPPFSLQIPSSFLFPVFYLQTAKFA